MRLEEGVGNCYASMNLTQMSTQVTKNAAIRRANPDAAAKVCGALEWWVEGETPAPAAGMPAVDLPEDFDGAGEVPEVEPDRAAVDVMVGTADVVTAAIEPLTILEEFVARYSSKVGNEYMVSL